MSSPLEHETIRGRSIVGTLAFLRRVIALENRLRDYPSAGMGGCTFAGTTLTAVRPRRLPDARYHLPMRFVWRAIQFARKRRDAGTATVDEIALANATPEILPESGAEDVAI